MVPFHPSSFVVTITRLASRDEYMGEWEKAGKMIETRGSSEWYCELPEDQWDLPKEIAMTQFVDGVGDKRQEMVPRIPFLRNSRSYSDFRYLSEWEWTKNKSCTC